MAIITHRRLRLAVLVFLSFLRPALPTARRRLSEHVLHYEPLHMDVAHAERIHRLARRDGGSTPQPLEISFKAFDRRFHLQLNHIGPTIAPATIIGEGIETQVDTYDLPVYEGHVIGEPNSHVRGRIFNGLFEGSIHLNHDTYHIEEGKKFQLGADSQSCQQSINQSTCLLGPVDPPRAVVYRWSDVRVQGANGVICGSYAHELLKSLRTDSNAKHHLKPQNIQTSQEGAKKRKRRASIVVSPTKNTCMIKMVADHTFFLAKGGTAQAISAMDYLIDRVNAIYNATDLFISDQNLRINVAPHSFIVYTDTSTKNPVREVSKSVTETLVSFSKGKWDDVCLAHLVTHRDFSDGILGLAWVADAGTGSAGGICQKRVNSADGEVNLNTGLSTSVNFGAYVAEAVAIATMAHEIGHGFGAPHDPAQCTSDGSDGNYLMFAKATPGNRPNNNKFSPCSIAIIKDVVAKKATCFTEYPRAVCGNGRRENTEECDCGGECTPESCCTSDCKIVGQCSPLVGGCCTSQCVFAANNSVCRADMDCVQQSLCTGTSGECPPPQSKQTDSPCGNGAFLCKANGVCSTSPDDTVCRLYGLPACTNTNEECIVSCNFGSECVSTLERSKRYPDFTPAYFPGTYPCANSKGYCNGAGKCILIVTDPVEVLKDFFTTGNILMVADMIRHYWYMFLGGALTLLALNVAVNVCARRQRPKAPPQSTAIVNTSQDISPSTLARKGTSGSNNSGGSDTPKPVNRMGLPPANTKRLANPKQPMTPNLSSPCPQRTPNAQPTSVLGPGGTLHTAMPTRQETITMAGPGGELVTITRTELVTVHRQPPATNDERMRGPRGPGKGVARTQSTGQDRLSLQQQKV